MAGVAGALSVVIVAASAATRAELRGAIEGRNGIRVAGETGDLAAALSGRMRADVLLLAGEAIELPPRRDDGLGIVLIGSEQSGEPRRVNATLPVGASSGEIAGAIHAAAAGLFVVSARSEPRPPITTVLTPREIEVLRMIADGLPNKAIATSLGITAHTVKFHIASIMSKFGAASRTEAVTAGLRRGLILL